MTLPTKEAVESSIPKVAKLPLHLRELISEYLATWDGAKKYAFCEAFLERYQEHHQQQTGAQIPSTRTQYVLTKLLGGYSGPDFNYLMTTGRQLSRKDVGPEVRERVWGLLDSGEKRVSNVYQVLREANRARKVSERSLGEEIVNVIGRETSKQGSWSKKLQFDLETDAVDHVINKKKQEDLAARSKQRTSNGAPKKRGKSVGAEELKVLRAAFENYLNVMFNDHVPSELDRSVLRRTYQDDFSLLIARFKKAADYKSEGFNIDLSGGVDEARVIDACVVLELEYPEHGAGFDEDAMKVAKAKFRRKALEAHPDQGGSEGQFNKLIDAYNLLQELHKTAWSRAY